MHKVVYNLQTTIVLFFLNKSIDINGRKYLYDL